MCINAARSSHDRLQMSQFHWHVTDSQSFPLEVPGFTELASKGAYDSTMVYSPSDVQDIVDYAGAVSFVFLVQVMLQEAHECGSAALT